MNLFEQYFSSYMGSRAGFERFHNEVINMPRDQFSDAGLNKIRTLSGYLLLTEGKLGSGGCSYKDMMLLIRNELSNDNFPKYRDCILEKRYFTFDNINTQYESEGRMFRHLMSLCAFFGFITSISRQKKIINYSKCKEYYLSDNEVLMPIARNNIMMLNVANNDFIKSLKGIAIDASSDYRPTYAILRYINDIDRPVTKFELSVLLGRIDDFKTDTEIIRRALEIGRVLPRTAQEQTPYFFSKMDWVNSDGTHFVYAASQEPDFKFNSYLLFLEAFDLIEFDRITDTYTMTAYATSLLADDISYLVADLERLLNVIDDYEEENKELNDLILYQRNPELLRLAREDTNFIMKMNRRSLNKPLTDRHGKRQRNRLIAELAKIQAAYMCQYAQKHVFRTPNGKYYCEAHHIIEFSTENGPDITNNLVVLGPEAHKIIHHACQEEIDNLFLQLIRNSALGIAQFKEMATIYCCLTIEHINALHNKHIITNNEKAELLALVAP